MRVLRRCAYNDPSNQLCRAVGFRIEDSEMKQVNARILNQPQIQTGPGQRANVFIGRIPLDGHMFTPKPLSALAITYFGPDATGAAPLVQQFIKALRNVSCLLLTQGHENDESLLCRCCRIIIWMHDTKVTLLVQAWRRSINTSLAYNKEAVNSLFASWMQETTMLCNNWSWTSKIVVLFDTVSVLSPSPDIVQSMNLSSGIMTQCTSLAKIAANRPLTSYCENLVRKINFKNAGINTKVNLNEALKNKKSVKDSLMFFGADVIHPTNVTRQHPSIAGRSSQHVCAEQWRKTRRCFSL